MYKKYAPKAEINKVFANQYQLYWCHGVSNVIEWHNEYLNIASSSPPLLLFALAIDMDRYLDYNSYQPLDCTGYVSSDTLAATSICKLLAIGTPQLEPHLAELEEILGEIPSTHSQVHILHC